MASSQSIRSENEMVPQLRRPVMPANLFRAVIKGDSNVLIPRLGLQPDVQVTIEASSAPDGINTGNQTDQSELQTATRFGDTILHLLITKGHNELALMVFQRDMSLLKARNNISETPLYCAAKVGNEEVIRNLIQSDGVIVKEALQERNKNGDTALHVAAKHDHRDISRMLMKSDAKLAYNVNDKKEYPLYMAIIEGYTNVVKAMLEVDRTLTCTPFSDGMFPVHEAARMDNADLILHFLEEYPDDAELLDPHGRNFFHIAAEDNQSKIFTQVFKNASQREMLERMNTATDYEGNTPFHIAAKMGHRTIMKAIWKHYQAVERVQNKKGYTPLELSAKQVVQNNEDIDDDMIDKYLKTQRDKFTRKWFRVVIAPQLENKWEGTQVIGLGSVLITTVAFAATFAIPGGYNQDNGTPILGRRYIFRAFIIADASAFLLAFLSLFALILNGLPSKFSKGNIPYATYSFMFAASTMVLAFGLGMYVTLAPVCYPIAVSLLAITLFVGSPALFVVIYIAKLYSASSTVSAQRSNRTYSIFLGVAYSVCFLIIFCLAFM